MTAVTAFKPGHVGDGGYTSLMLSLAPTAYWRLNEANGIVGANYGSLINIDLTMTPNSGGAWTGGTLNAQPGAIARDSAGAALFDGTGYGISSYYGVTGTAARSIVAWVKLLADTGSPNDGVVAWGTTTNGAGWRMAIHLTNHELRTEVSGGYKVGVTDLNDGAWHMLAHTVEAGQNVTDVLQYVDGVVEGLGSQSARTINTATGTSVHVGSKENIASSATGLNADISEVAIFDYAVSATDLALLAAQGIN